MTTAGNSTFDAADKAADLAQTLGSVLAARREILDAYLFGSFATGRAQARSDVDVAVYVDADHCPDAPYGYQAELTTILMRALGRSDIDVVVLNRAPPLLYHRVLRDGRRVFARNSAQATTREGQALSRYYDYAVQLAKIDALGLPSTHGGHGAMSPGSVDATVVQRHLRWLPRWRTYGAIKAAPPRNCEATPICAGWLSAACNFVRKIRLTSLPTWVAAHGLDAPDYGSTIDGLVELGVLDSEFASRFRAIASFRNVLVHGYLSVDPDLVARTVNQRLDDFDAYSAQACAYLGKSAN